MKSVSTAIVSSTGRQQRRLPRVSELRPLLRFRRPRLNPTARRLERAHTIDDLRSIAERRVPRAIFDYVDGGAEAEIGVTRSRAAFGRVEFHARALRDVSTVRLRCDVLGAPSELPLVLAPTGFTRLMHHAGEIAVARAAARAGVPYVLSTLGTTDLDVVRASAPGARQWFQLYLWRDRGASEHLIARARDAGYEALVLTVDTPVAGARLRDVRNGLTIPPTLGLRTLAGLASRPAWWLNALTTEPLTFATMNSFDGTPEELAARIFDPSASIADLQWLREAWPGKLVVKGLQSVRDAEVFASNGADAVVVSNHGGRQLDRSATPLELLPRVVDAVGDRCEVMVDSGVRSGADLAAARALGASAAMVGRSYLYGLMAGGERGVDRSLEIYRSDYMRTLQLLGVASTDAMTSEHASLR